MAFFPVVKNLPANVGDPGLIPGLGRSPGEGNGNPLQYSCLGNPMDRRAWWATIHGVTRVGHDFVTKGLGRASQVPQNTVFENWEDFGKVGRGLKFATVLNSRK